MSKYCFSNAELLILRELSISDRRWTSELDIATATDLGLAVARSVLRDLARRGLVTGPPRQPRCDWILTTAGEQALADEQRQAA